MSTRQLARCIWEYFPSWKRNNEYSVRCQVDEQVLGATSIYSYEMIREGVSLYLHFLSHTLNHTRR